ncbi:hypothetical protein [Lutibacter citreus]|uniref:hypothetical protein n=1 Tax=Lutibacter citreus TaxID=2138210 RepID=UPI000DBE9A7A|nr:hypothetical protein [Lutibacter citreus]
MRKNFLVLLALLLSCSFISAQDVTSHRYRKVAPENLAEYLNNEVTYWSAFSQSEIDKGYLKFWAVLERVGGENLRDEPNILLITQFNDIDRPVDWESIKELFPNEKFKDMMMEDLFINTDIIYLRDLGNDIFSPNIDLEKDIKYVRINYHNMTDMWWHLNFEAQKVKPFFEEAMKKEKTTIKGWGNSLILTPKSDGFKYKTESHEYFSNFRDALGPNDFYDYDFPDGFFKDWQKNYVGERNARIYKIIAFKQKK